MKQPTEEEFAAMRKAWKPWGRHGWDSESFALGWFLALGYKDDILLDAVHKREREPR